MGHKRCNFHKMNMAPTTPMGHTCLVAVTVGYNCCESKLRLSVKVTPTLCRCVVVRNVSLNIKHYETVSLRGLTHYSFL